MKEKLAREWNKILSLEKTSPYVFRTRLERTIKHTINYANEKHQDGIKMQCRKVLDKLQYISDQSNQTSDGCLNSFIVLKEDMLYIQKLFACI